MPFAAEKKGDGSVVKELELVPDVFGKFFLVFVLNGVPFVHTNDQRPAFFMRVASHGSVMTDDSFGGIDYEEDNIRHPDVTARHHDA